MATNLIDKTYNLITMTKKFIVLFLMLLLPIMIWAQNSVTFDFSSSSQEVQNTIEKDDIVLNLVYVQEAIPSLMKLLEESLLVCHFR